MAIWNTPGASPPVAGIGCAPGVARELGRLEGYELACLQRKREATLDPEGLSTTADAVLARILEGTLLRL